MYAVCDEVNFQEGTGIGMPESQGDALLNKIRRQIQGNTASTKSRS